jgi:serine/threonine-protein kinase
LEDFLSRIGPLGLEQLVEVLHIDQRERWRAGETILAETYLQSYPSVAENMETALDLIYSEFRFRADIGDKPSIEEFLGRFPQFRASLEEQFQFYRAMVSEPLSDPPHSISRIDARVRGLLDAERGRPKVAMVAGSGPQSTGEIQSLLQRRLRFLSLLTAGSMIVSALLVAEFWRGGGIMPPGNGPNFAVCLCLSLLAAAVAGILWTRPTVSLRRLRVLELIGFASPFAYWSWIDGFVYPELSLGDPPFWFGLIMAVSVSAPWVFMIIAYGIFIPNTWRRCAAVVGFTAMAPIVISLTGGLAEAASKGHSQVVYFLTLTSYVACAAAIAIFGAHRIEVLRQEALAARRLGQYQLKRQLGTGGMGEVYLAEHVLLRRPCAIKLIRPQCAGDPTNLLRFEREVQVTATLTHPNTVEILDYGRAEDGTFYYVMEYLPGLTLEQLVEAHGPLPPERVVHLLRQVCGPLQEAHAVGLIHRDIKPGNMIVCERGGRHDVVKLLDFGLVQVHSLEEGVGKLTQQGAIAGTPAYMSPEQGAGQAALDGRSDLYSLGAVAYFLLTGQPPFVRDTAVQTLAAHLCESVVALDRHRPDVPADLQAAVQRCLEKGPARRFPDAGALAEALARCGCARQWTTERAAAWWRAHTTANSEARCPPEQAGAAATPRS